MEKVKVNVLCYEDGGEWFYYKLDDHEPLVRQAQEILQLKTIRNIGFADVLTCPAITADEPESVEEENLLPEFENVADRYYAYDGQKDNPLWEDYGYGWTFVKNGKASALCNIKNISIENSEGKHYLVVEFIKQGQLTVHKIKEVLQKYKNGLYGRPSSFYFWSDKEKKAAAGQISSHLIGTSDIDEKAAFFDYIMIEAYSSLETDQGDDFVDGYLDLELDIK